MLKKIIINYTAQDQLANRYGLGVLKATARFKK